MRTLAIITGLLIATAAGVPRVSQAGQDKKGKAPDLVFVDEKDKEMNAAMEKARKSVDDFIKAFQKPKKGQSDFGIKVGITDGKQVEHFWVAVTKFDGKQFEGTINNEPALVKTIKEGEAVTVEKGKISDWMFVENKKLVGGYTVRVLRNRLTPEERKALDESIPYKIDP
jgi:uncharacterized protein YegJ (DUF2314 family)